MFLVDISYSSFFIQDLDLVQLRISLHINKTWNCVVKSNTEARSRNHCYIRRAINITYSQCVSVAPSMESACVVVCHLWPVWIYHNISETARLAGVVSGLHASLQPGHYSSLTAPNLQPTAYQERKDQCGNQHYSLELQMMGRVMPETC